MVIAALGLALAPVSRANAVDESPSDGPVLVVWGSNTDGQLANGSTVSSTVPVAAALAKFRHRTLTQISAQSSTACALAKGRTFCWGAGDQGQIGNGSTADSLTPKAVTTGVLPKQQLQQVSVGSEFACALSKGGRVFCWGGNANGELGNGTTADSNVPVRVDMGGALKDKRVVSLAAGRFHTCALTTERGIYCWGRNNAGQLGDGTLTNSSVPVKVAPGALPPKKAQAIVAGVTHTCALSVKGRIYCWGANSSGQLGDGSTTDSTVPVAANTGRLAGEKFANLSAGLARTCAVTTGNRALCWGTNTSGALGIGSSVVAAGPTLLDTSALRSSERFTFVSAGDGFSGCATTTRNRVFCWGSNDRGQLGNGTNAPSNSPVKVRTADVLKSKNMTAVAVGAFFVVTLAEKRA